MNTFRRPFAVTCLVERYWLAALAATALAIQAAYPAPAQQAYLKASNPGGGDAFGWAIAISGDTMVVGTPNEDSAASGVNGDQANNDAIESGAAYVFVRHGGVWTQQGYLKASNPNAADQFGWSVAISGDTVVVGAYEEDSSARGIDGDQTDNGGFLVGAAYVFVRHGTTWAQQAYLKPSNPSPADYFGWSVAIAGDTVVVGAPTEDSGATGVNGDQNNNAIEGSGAAYVYVRNGTTWTQQAYLKASNPGPGDNFGIALAISGDTIVVGAQGEDSSAPGVNADQANNTGFNTGAAYVFGRTGTNWSQQAYLKASNAGDGDLFGWSVAASGDTVVVGALGEDSSGTGVNGNQDSNDAPNSGAAYVFVRSSGGWTEQAWIKASNTGTGDAFGFVALSGDTLVIGAPGEDGHSTGINGTEDTDGAQGAGAAYVFTRTSGTWTQQAYLKASNTGAGDQFGASVAVSGDTVVTGAHGEDSSAAGVNGDQTNNNAANPGAAYVFSGLGLPMDSDGDEVPDLSDACPNTPQGAIVDATGCSIPQLVPCDASWRGHGEYVRALLVVSSQFLEAGLITREQWREILRQGVESDCGKVRGE